MQLFTLTKDLMRQKNDEHVEIQINGILNQHLRILIGS